jgi:DNA-binding MarR family transcriptional regulator
MFEASAETPAGRSHSVPPQPTGAGDSEQPTGQFSSDTIDGMSAMSSQTLSIAALLAQLGQHSADRFSARIAELDLTGPQAGILRAIAGEPGRSQQALSEQLGLLPSRVVAFIDDLERRTLLQRRRNPGDRRLYALYLTEQGEALMNELAAVSEAHEAEITTGLSEEQRSQLSQLLTDLAERQQLAGGQSGYPSMGRSRH